MCIRCIYIYINLYIHIIVSTNHERACGSSQIVQDIYVNGALPKFKPRCDADTYGTDDDFCTHQSSRSGGGLDQ